MTKKIFLDMDPGIDDALAIMIATKMKGFKVVGISTVAGNVDVAKTTRNALRILEFLNEDIPVYSGASKPLTREHVASEYVHGEDGLGNVALTGPRRKKEKLPAPCAIVEAARREDIDLIATGPLTNVAIAYILEPLLPKMLNNLFIMGGAYGITEYGKGNVTAFSEYNIYADPEAAKLVFSKFDNVTAIGLDVTMDPKILLLEEDLKRLRGSSRATLAADMMKYIIDRYGYFAPHDPIAVFCAYDASTFEFVKHGVDVLISEGEERGRTVLSNSAPKVNIAKSVDSSVKEKFMEFLF